MTSLACIFRVWIGPDVSSKSSQIEEGCPLPIVSRAWHFDSPFQQECKSNSILHVGLAMQRVAGLQCCVVLFLLAIFVYQKNNNKDGTGSRIIGPVLAGYILCRHFFDLIDTEKNYIIWWWLTQQHIILFLLFFCTQLLLLCFLFVVASCALH